MVEMAGGGVKKMREVKVGDRVHVGGGVYDEVMVWTHRAEGEWGAFVEVGLRDGRRMAATVAHMVYTRGGVVKMGDVGVGDWMRAGDGAWVEVVEVRRDVRKGVWNPQTVGGDIVVDGVWVTSYTGGGGGVAAGHGLLAPVRWWWRSGGCGGWFEAVAAAVESVAAVVGDVVEWAAAAREGREGVGSTWA